MTSARPSLKQRLSDLVRQHKSPREIARGVAIGVFIAITPLYGLHTLMVVTAAFLFKRANIIAMLIGTSISNTLTVPFITWAGYSIGRHMLGRRYPPLSWQIFRGFDYRQFLHLYLPLFVGSVVLGVALAVVFYHLTLALIPRMTKKDGKASLVAVCSAAALCLAPPSFAESLTLSYAISPFGRAEYRNEGMVEEGGRKMLLTVFTTHVPMFSDVEKIYSDPQTLLPVRVERAVTFLVRRERLVEEYDQKNRRLVIRKFVNDKEVKTYNFVSDGPFQNAITLPFCLDCKRLEVGWKTVVRIPDQFTVTLTSIEQVRVPAGTFTAYRFDSTPRRFQIWISADGKRVPVKIKGLGKYSLQLKK